MMNVQFITPNMPQCKWSKLSENALMHTLNTQTHTQYLKINIIVHIQNIKTFIESTNNMDGIAYPASCRF